MSGMMLKIHRVPGSCPMGCCGFLNLKKNTDRRIARKIQRQREKRVWQKFATRVDTRRMAW